MSNLLLGYFITFMGFIFFANPDTFKLVRKFLGDWVASADGLATLPGLAFHALIFMAVVGYYMRTKVGKGVSEYFTTRQDQQTEEYSLWAKRNELQ